MAKYILTDDDSLHTGGEGGPLGNPKFVKKKIATVRWTFPANAPRPTSFEIILYYGTSILDEDKYIIRTTVSGDENVFTQTLGSLTIGNSLVKAGVRAVYNAK